MNKISGVVSGLALALAVSTAARAGGEMPSESEMWRMIQEQQRPTLIISHNKTLAAQLYGEFRDFFPNNAVHYFVSYFDYYQAGNYWKTHRIL